MDTQYYSAGNGSHRHISGALVGASSEIASDDRPIRSPRLRGPLPATPTLGRSSARRREQNAACRWRAKARHSPGPPGDCLLDRDDNTDRLGEITCPAIVFHGTADVSIEIDKAEALCRALYGCTGVVRVERAPHASNLAHPEQVNGALLEFLRSVD